MDFFPPSPEPLELDEPDDDDQPAWLGAPSDVLPGVVPVELVLGRSDSTVVVLTGVRAFPTGLAMNLGVRVRGPVRRRDLHAEVFDGPFAHSTGADWQARRLKWGFELADGRRVTNVDPWPVLADEDDDGEGEPERPLLVGGGGGGGSRSVDRDYWLWPLPPAGRLLVVCQWLDQGIDTTTQELDAAPFLEAAGRARPVWPSP